MKRIFGVMLAVAVTFAGASVLAEGTQQAPAKPAAPTAAAATTPTTTAKGTTAATTAGDTAKATAEATCKKKGLAGDMLKKCVEDEAKKGAVAE